MGEGSINGAAGYCSTTCWPLTARCVDHPASKYIKRIITREPLRLQMLESFSIPLKERDNLKEEGKHSVPLPEFHTLYAYVIEVSGSQEFNAQIRSGSYPSLASVAWPDLVVLWSKFFSKFSESAAADVT